MGRALAVLLLMLFLAFFVVMVFVKFIAFGIKLALLGVILLAALLAFSRLRSHHTHETALEPEHMRR